jgi:YD repeat-containing protein
MTLGGQLCPLGALNRRVSSTDPLGHTTTTAYDAADERVAVTATLGSPSSGVYSILEDSDSGTNLPPSSPACCAGCAGAGWACASTPRGEGGEVGPPPGAAVATTAAFRRG